MKKDISIMSESIVRATLMLPFADGDVIDKEVLQNVRVSKYSLRARLLSSS